MILLGVATVAVIGHAARVPISEPGEYTPRQPGLWRQCRLPVA